MICLICRQAQPAPGFSSVVFERGEMKLVIKSVPSLICRSCGEVYVNASIAARLLQLAEHTAEWVMSERARGYSELEFTMP